MSHVPFHHGATAEPSGWPNPSPVSPTQAEKIKHRSTPRINNTVDEQV